jgi:peptidoglycan/LPS O-acetylase OafA/YrhL
MLEQRFLTLDALRGVAAIAVLTLHVPDRTFANFLPGSYLAVDLFFLLSGFVLAHAYDARLRSGLSARAFMLQRYIRLAPCFMVGSAIGLGLACYAVTKGALPAEQAIASGASSLLFLPTPFALLSNVFLFPLNAPAWSLFFELLANLIFAVPALRTRAGALILTGLSAVGLVWCAFVLGTLDGGFRASTAYVGLARVAFSFFAGVIIYRWWRRSTFRLSLPAPVLCLATIGIFAIHAEGGARAGFDCLAVLLIFPAMIVLGAGARPGRYPAIASLLGNLSYPLYATHVPLIRLLGLAVGLTYGDQAMSAFGAVGSVVLLGICIAFAFGVERLIDQPARRWLSARWRSKAVSASAD